MHRRIIGFQGVYYLITGIWPIIHLASFEKVTGPKTDDWLVQTVGVLAATIGATLLIGLRRPAPNTETKALFFLAAVAFLVVDTVFSLRGIISKIYLIDAAEQVLAMLLFVLSLRRGSSS